MVVLITGATGLIGSKIVEQCLLMGHTIHYLTTSRDKIQTTSTYKGFYWDPYNDDIDDACFDQVEIIINLVGASIAKRWTSSYRKTILDSRTKTTTLLYKRVKNLHTIVRHVISASAIGIYKSSYTNFYTEESTEFDDGFLGMVVQEWEAAVDQFQHIGIMTSKVRIGLVLSNDGGAYPAIEKPVKYYLGAAFGDGKQWQSWIHIDDLVNIFLHIANEELSGVYNGVAPNPVSNNRLTQVVSDAHRTRVLLPNVPRFIMKIALGKMHQLLFDSQRVSARKIQDTGYMFEHDNVHSAINALVHEQKEQVNTLA